MSTYLDVLRYRELLGNLFRRDLQAKYRGSALGVLWTIANPVMLMGVYLLVFGVVWKSPFATGGHYPLFLLTGLALWTFFAAAVQSSTRSMLDNANLIRKTRFPRQLVPLSVVLAHLVSFGAMLVILLVVNFIALPRVRATEWLAIPLSVLFVGGGHSPEDLMLLVREDNVLFAGDMLFSGRIPFVGNANSKAWLAALDKMLTLKPKVVVPGHGPISRDPERDASLTRDYLRYLRVTMGRAARDMEDFDTAYSKVDWSRYASLPAFKEANRGNAYSTYLLMEKEALEAR